MNKKRKFRITLNESRAEGAELKIGTVSVEFVKYWQKRDGLIEHLESIVDGKEEDANSPPMRDGKNFPWNECADIEHILSPYDPTVNGFKVEEITLSKRNNLILNVDGFIACSILDCLLYHSD